MDDTISYCSRAYSDISSVTHFGQKANKWEAIINSGKCVNDGVGFWDEYAYLKLQKDDDGLKVVKELQRELNSVRVTGMRLR